MPSVLFGRSHNSELSQIRKPERKTSVFSRGFDYNQFVSAEKFLNGQKRGQLA